MVKFKASFTQTALFSTLLILSNSAFTQQQLELGANQNSKPKVLGILGGGQLGRMLALSAANLGVKVKVLDPSATPPAGVAAQAVQGSFRDAQSVQDFAAQVDVLTVEIEHVDAPTLVALSTHGTSDIQPAAQTIAVIQDKYAQKQHFNNAGVALGEFADIPDAASLQTVAAAYGYPLMLKSKRLAYDGRGNYVINGPTDHEAAVTKLGGYGHGLYAEKWQNFSKELAVMVVRARNGEIKLYPVTETIQRDSICHVTETPARISPSVRKAAENLARQAVQNLEGAGMFGVEMFLVDGNKVILNEVAPRVHNSGHYTIDGCVTSQFENHIRATLDLPLGDTSLKTAHVIMLNILGEADGVQGEKLASNLIQRALATPGCSVHWYDKNGVTKGRKIGHINIVGKSMREARERLRMLDSKAYEKLVS